MSLLGRQPSSASVLFAWLVAALLAIYGFDIGQGFIKDDFAWIASSRIRGLPDITRIFTGAASGFYRPLVALSFGINELVFGLTPIGYGLTNFVLLLATLTGIAFLAETLGFTRAQGVCAGAIWALNFHGIDMSLLWISGRTELLLCSFAVFAAIALARNGPSLAGLLAFAAMLSKEEAIVLPFVFLAWTVLDLHMRREGERAGAVITATRRVWPSFVGLAVYAALRGRTNAITPSTAPWFYRFSLEPRVVSHNVFEYLDRSLTVTAAILLCLVLIARRRSTLDPIQRLTVAKAIVWIAGGFALTMWLPVRSSLYVCFPLVGSALLGLALATAIWRDVPGRLRARLVALGLLLPLAMIPVYRLRHDDWVSDARLSARVMQVVTTVIRNDPRIDTLVFYDKSGARPSLMTAFDGLLPEAVEFEAGRRVIVQVYENVEPERVGGKPQNPRLARIALEKGQLSVVQ